MKRAWLLALLLASGSAAAAKRCALVVASQPEPEPAILDAARRQVADRCRFIEDAASRGALERFARPTSPEDLLRDALARAHARMRRFDAAGVHDALDQARAAVTSLPPTTEAQKLVVQVALDAAELAIIEQDSAAQLRAMRLALAVEPSLRLDDARGSPVMLALLARARGSLERAQRMSIPIESQPAGARVWTGGWRGETPMALELSEGPALIWLSRAGYRSRAVPIDVTPSTRIAVTLEPLSEGERLQPLVDALRLTPRESRPQPARALAAALGVDAVVVVEAGSPTPIVYAAEMPAPAAERISPPARPATTAARPRPWYKKTWPWIVIAGGATLAATAVGVGVGVGAAPPPTFTCCR
jgi:hypothetical protein